MSLLKQNITRKERVKKVPELDAIDDSKEYELEVIRNSAVYTMELESGHLPGLYYLVAWKSYPEEENTWEPISAVQDLGELISLFHKDHLKKPRASSPSIHSALTMGRATVKPMAKSTTNRKQGRPANSANKQAKKNWNFCSFPHITSS